MNRRVLLLDDEPAILNAISRRLGEDFEITTVGQGAEALRILSASEPFAVVVTDMRMPQMNGIEFLAQAHDLAPDTTYMMLTGNQDVATAVAAVNEGHVYRFLNKPCQSEHMRQALEAGIQQYQLITGEKELLHKTFCGAVGVLTDVLASTSPAVFSHCDSIQSVFSRLLASLAIEERWEFKLAAKFSLLGYSLLPELSELTADAGDLQLEHLPEAARLGKKLIERIPRLGTVGEIIGEQARTQGAFHWSPSDPPTTAQIVATGSTVLRLAILIDWLSKQGIEATDGLQEIRREMPALTGELLDAIELSWPSLDDMPVVEVGLSELQEGYVLAEDLHASGGACLVRRGRRLTQFLIEKLDQSAQLLHSRVRIYQPPAALRNDQELVINA